MAAGTLLLIGAVFFVAGFAKGVIGLGLPTIAMGLLALALSPVEAAGILVLPSLLTNAWQMVVGPSLLSLIRRLWPMMLAVCIGTWTGLGLMSGAGARYGTMLLGGALVAYALIGLLSARLVVASARESLWGPAVGAVTGLITASTGVFVIPAVPYLQAIGLEKEELMQALGLSFTVSTLALAVNVAAAGGFDVAMAGSTVLALALAVAGMAAGQFVRHRLSAALFRRCFFTGLLLGVHLMVRASF
ncbi:sulfite exporter TauE/SafE family protein [soil metagenome]